MTKKLNVTLPVIRALEEQGVLKIESEQVYRNPVKQAKKSQQEIIYTEEQQHVIQGFRQDYLCGTRRTYLLHGVTGSGKTEVYMEMIRTVVDQGKQAIVLIPEIALTYQTVMRFYRLFRRQSFYHELKTVCRRTLRSDDACKEGRGRCDDRTTLCTFYSISGSWG